jgi:hypothetical protein
VRYKELHLLASLAKTKNLKKVGRGEGEGEIANYVITMALDHLGTQTIIRTLPEAGVRDDGTSLYEKREYTRS